MFWSPVTCTFNFIFIYSLPIPFYTSFHRCLFSLPHFTLSSFDDVKLILKGAISIKLLFVFVSVAQSDLLPWMKWKQGNCFESHDFGMNPYYNGALTAKECYSTCPVNFLSPVSSLYVQLGSIGHHWGGVRALLGSLLFFIHSLFFNCVFEDADVWRTSWCDEANVNTTT